MKCDHIVGLEGDWEGDYLRRCSEITEETKVWLDVVFKFCPECGESLKNIRFRKHPNKKEKPTVFDEALVKKILELTKQASPFLRALKQDEPFTREIK